MTQRTRHGTQRQVKAGPKEETEVGNPHTTAFLCRLVSSPFSVDSHPQLTGRCMAIPKISGLHVRARKKQTCHIFPNATFKLPESRTWLFPRSPLIYPALSNPRACVNGPKAICRERVQGISGIPTKL